ncbi:MAG: hypothetical protein EXS10_00655 [Phycisphaerales bacterium]|nr:hypothetical protein [Phycisphaerales bacterium]
MLTAFLFALTLALSEPPAATPPSIPAAVFIEAMPKDAKSASWVKKNTKQGDTVVFEAKIGGRAEPFVKNRASFMVADRALKSCDEIEGDTCGKPWDYCCESAESKKANMLMVQIVDASGKLLKCDANGVHGLAPLAVIVVEGVVASVDDKGNCTVDAKKIWVKPAAKKS